MESGAKRRDCRSMAGSVFVAVSTLDLCGYNPSRLLLHQTDAVNPEFAFNGTSGREALHPQYQQFCIRSGGKGSVHRLPEICIFQLVADEVCALFIQVLDSESRSASALYVFGLEVSRKIIGGVRLHRNQLPDARIFDPSAVKDNRQGALSALKLGGVQTEADVS